MIYPTLKYEQQLWDQGYKLICGLDEVGRGCFAGPVVVGAVVINSEIILPKGIADSKLLKPKTREKLAEEIQKAALFWSVAEISVRDINNVGIGKATQMAFRKAIRLLSAQVDFILMDAFYVKHLNRKKQQAIIKGDRDCLSIAAASIIAKVHRDELMVKLDKQFPQYGFAKHKGYGTKLHQQAIKTHGLSKIHRKSFNLTKFL